MNWRRQIKLGIVEIHPPIITPQFETFVKHAESSASVITPRHSNFIGIIILYCTRLHKHPGISLNEARKKSAFQFVKLAVSGLVV